MLSALTSLIWGTDGETPNLEESAPEKSSADDHVELDNDWIFIRPKDSSDNKRRRCTHFLDDGASTASESADSVGSGMEESWFVTPPQCFNSKRRRNKKAEMSPMENLLIEHPSMSIYQGNEEVDEKTEEVPKEIAVNRNETHRAVAGRLQLLQNRQPLKDLNRKSNDRKNSSPKNMKRKNMVYVRSHSSRKNKQYGRMIGKHTGMAGKRTT